MKEEEKINFKLFNLEETKKYFNEKKIENVILFSQALSGSPFISNILSEEQKQVQYVCKLQELFYRS